MSENAFFWIAGIFAVIVGAIGGALWKHVIEDGKVRERLATLEADNARQEEEIRSLRERWHDLRDNTLKEAWAMFQEWRDDLKQWFREQMQRDTKD